MPVRTSHLARLVAGKTDDPGRCALWQRRQEAITAAAARAPLATQTAVRLAAAGIQPDDPALQRIREHNRALGIRPAQPGAGPEAEAGP